MLPPARRLELQFFGLPNANSFESQPIFGGQLQRLSVGSVLLDFCITCTSIDLSESDMMKHGIDGPTPWYEVLFLDDTALTSCDSCVLVRKGLISLSWQSD